MSECMLNEYDIYLIWSIKTDLFLYELSEDGCVPVEYFSNSVIPLYFYSIISVSLSLSLSFPPGEQGEGELPGSAEVCESAERGVPQGADRGPGPPGPARGRCPPQGRGAVGDAPATPLPGAGDPGGELFEMLMKT